MIPMCLTLIMRTQLYPPLCWQVKKGDEYKETEAGSHLEVGAGMEYVPSLHLPLPGGLLANTGEPGVKAKYCIVLTNIQGLNHYSQ